MKIKYKQRFVGVGWLLLRQQMTLKFLAMCDRRIGEIWWSELGTLDENVYCKLRSNCHR